MREIKPFSTTGIGSLPHRRASEAVELTLGSLDIPFWPQLPHVSFREQMIPQYSEGMPSIKIDEKKESVWIERNDEEIARSYESLGVDARVAISEDYAKGLYKFLDAIKARRFEILKGHITGPLTFTLGLKDKDGRVLFYDEELREIALMLLKAKARWQVDALGAFAKGVIIFIDEPILSALGTSAYLGVSSEEVSRMLSETAEAIRQVGGISGIHCCGRADWPVVLKSGVDIMNFDAYSFGDTLAMYPAEVTAFLERGGYLAWGIVPTSDDIDKENEDSIIALFHKRVQEITSAGVPRELLLKRIILTPSCGTGSRTVEQTMKIFQILMGLKEEVAG